MILERYVSEYVQASEKREMVSLTQQIDLIVKNISDPVAQEAITYRALAKFKSNYIFRPEEFQTDLGLFKKLAQNLRKIDKREELVLSFEKVLLKEKGASFPFLKFMDTHGNMIGSESLFDDKNYLYIDVWASWCKPCIEQIPALKKLENQYAKRNIKFLSISIDSSPDPWHRALGAHNLQGVQLLDQDNQIGKILAIKGILRFLLYDPKGKLILIDAPVASNPEVEKIFNGLDSP